MQCKCDEGGWILEKREGDEVHHFRALSSREVDKGTEEAGLMNWIFAPRKQQGWYLRQGQVEEVMSSYLLAEREPDWLEWERSDV